GGVRVSFSSLAKNYNGTYSAQRQELVEQFGAYALLTEEFIDRVVRVMYRDFVEVAVLAGRVQMPRGWKLRHLAAASYVRPAMPWIDPLKESLAFAEQEDRGWISP
ncbi:phage portal protein, partial [Citrobacter braakii]|nr:phage portal protein [Citrobacter braakii]